jgi:hypothetical protein
MSYKQAMKWAKKHPKGIRHNYMGFDTGSGSWPAPWCKICDRHMSQCECLPVSEREALKRMADWDDLPTFGF